ncbi:DNA mismatch endonuclease Vsr [Rhodopseudomonas palustris]|uniref:very short patch repair endonuclease n=1 Tax=Rhodopseudomonas palustris TaxID=1076 RepID=UPI00115DA336|nr:very short patch repair endonuclease [Rhodopseudomonas palustris]QDL99514.1 DNA mismatch endonuclease Vsr [Rhodopseudomonas palustris]
MDRISRAQRSANMRAVKSQDTGPEMLVRRAAHAMGLRFRLHKQDLPGRPDLTFARYRTAVFVHGCFWHGHAGCSRAKLPSSNFEFWSQKLKGNVERDRRNQEALERGGWHVAVVWQCQIPDLRAATEAVSRIPSLRRFASRRSGGAS